MLFRGEDDRFEEELCGAVTRVADDVYLLVFDDVNHSFRILVDGSLLVASPVYACDAEVQFVEFQLFRVEFAFGVENVQFGAHHDFHAVHFARNDAEISEIHGVARIGHGGTVVCDAKHFQTLHCCGLRHLLNGAVGMAAHHCVRVHVE